MTGHEAKRAVMFVYYHPSRSGLKNPAGPLRKLGFVSFDGSCWFGHEDAVAAINVSGWKEAGARWQTVPFTEMQWESIREIARMALEKHVAEVRATLDEKAAKAQAMFAQANREQSIRGVQKASWYFAGRVRVAKQRLNEALEAALIFDLMGDAASLFDALRLAVDAHEETSSTVRAMVRERAKNLKHHPTAAWGFQQVEMEEAS
jgi:hypothetical protein